jgi:hypothetical protein
MTGAASYCGLVGAFLPVAALAATNHAKWFQNAKAAAKNGLNSADRRPAALLKDELVD